MKLHEFYLLARKNTKPNDAPRTYWRYGQALFNTLLEVRPDLAEKVRRTMADPFYANDEGDDRVEAFCKFLVENWDNSVDDINEHEWTK